MSRRRDPVPAFSGEAVLGRVNHGLESLERELTAAFERPQLPVVFILGPPRTGTTLLYQLLADWGGFAWVSNFLARFWMTPFVGSVLEQEIGIRESLEASTYRSESGATFSPAEPHEFTWFWNRWFDHGQETQKLGGEQLQGIDREALAREVAAMEFAWEAPMVFKNSFWHNFQVGYLADVFPDAVFVRCQRDPVYAAQSIVLSREALRGDRESWWSMKPAEYPELVDRSWWEQVSGQVHHTERELDRALEELSTDRVIAAPYAEVCNAPGDVVRRIVDAVNRRGAEVPTSGDVPTSFTTTDRVRLSNEDFERLRKASRELAAARG